jgi:transposase
LSLCRIEREAGWRPELDPRHLIFIDESDLSNKMARLRGWAKKAERCRAAIPLGHWKIVTLVGRLTANGFIAPMLRDGPLDGEAFVAWYEHLFAPARAEDSIVVMDNLAAHKVTGVCEAIVGRGASLLYLPPDSPDLTPIANGFSRIKVHMGKLVARAIDTLHEAAADALETVTPKDCTNFFVHAGYGSHE